MFWHLADDVLMTLAVHNDSDRVSDSSILRLNFMRRLMIFAMVTCPFLAAADIRHLDEIVVIATKTEQTIRETSRSITSIDEEMLARISATHINESLQRVPGVWISRGNGQEHLTAIRSPVLTGAGGCGAFVMAQDGISVRAPGFCNVNELFETNSELASRIEVFRGPGSSIYGSNAVHGVINVRTPMPKAQLRRMSLEAGPNDYARVRVGVSGESLRLDLSGTTDGGYKDDSGFDQQKLLLKHHHVSSDREITTTLSYTNLNQETAGFVRGDDVYKDSGIKRDNPNPEAYRDARSIRLLTDIRFPISDGTLHLKPYARHVDMTFLQHFLPGQAIEENGHTSVGMQLLFESDQSWHLGFEVEQTQGFLRETQPGPTQGSAFLVATIPAGKHYDYEVDATLAGLFATFDHDLNDQTSINGGVRYQYTRYDYDNQMLDGRTRDDGMPCGFGGCRFSRPADRDDSFSNLSPHLGFVYTLRDDVRLFGQIARGFRAPQATELYRLQNAQVTSDIDTVTLDSIELGVRGDADQLSWDISLFAMEKDNFIFRNTNRENIDDGETSHQGIEIDVAAVLSSALEARLAMTWARHRYENNPALSRDLVKGNDIDTAPRTLGSASLLWRPTERHNIELEWVHIGEYYTDPENNNEYDGHNLLHLRGKWQLNPSTTIHYRLMNLTDEDYAERADYAFGFDRYFVGTPRSVYAGVTITL